MSTAGSENPRLMLQVQNKNKSLTKQEYLHFFFLSKSFGLSEEKTKICFKINWSYFLMQ